jgi:hypothetical protein
MGIVRRQKNRDWSDISNLPDSAQRGLGNQGFLKVRADKPTSVSSLGFNHPGIDAIDSDLSGTEFAG